ncbi:unnamed protein product [Prorocentrum cordatum]|uniref:Nudix hydrolase domain-containing protein n=1 Tax=Prorocentrum cordatum TaxID=2364126 RepID=A0ABN9TZY9_9DINO|nr:unnamed protein product [Polarella glacialis]
MLIIASRGLCQLRRPAPWRYRAVTAPAAEAGRAEPPRAARPVGAALCQGVGGEPRQKNAQVVILTRVEEGRPGGGPRVLLQLRSREMPVMPGHLATVGGMRDRSDRDSRDTALREVWEETGLVDPGRLAGAAGPARRRALELGAPPPLELRKFGEGAHVDWWVLLLEGAGTFEPRARDAHECQDAAPVLPLLPEGSSLAPCFGHAWVRSPTRLSLDSATSAPAYR